MHRSIYSRTPRNTRNHCSWFIIMNYWLNWLALERCFGIERTNLAQNVHSTVSLRRKINNKHINYVMTIVTRFLDGSNGTGFNLQWHGSKHILKIHNLFSQNLHVYEPESRLDWSLEHRDWPICGHKCSTKSGSTARRRLDHPETITSSEKHSIVSRIDERNAHCRMVFRILG